MLDYAKQQNIYPGLENRITYIAKLYNEEFHLLARREIKSPSPTWPTRRSMSICAALAPRSRPTRLFDLLNIPVIAYQ